MVEKSKNNWTVATLFDEICALEVKHNLFELQIDGIFFWKLIRFELFMELTQKLGLYGEGHPDMSTTVSFNKKVFRIIGRIWVRLAKSPFHKKRMCDSLIFTHPRKSVINGKDTDIYSYDLEDAFHKSGKMVFAVEKKYVKKHTYSYPKNTIYSEALSLYFFYLNILFDVNKKVEKQRGKVLHHLVSIAGIPLSEINALSSKYLKNQIVRFKNEFRYYTKMFHFYQPKQIFVVVAYGKEPMIAAAQKLNISVTEIQHGTILKQHIGYSYPKSIKIPYFPNSIRMWGKFWYDNSLLPIIEENVEYVGFSHLAKEINKYSDVIRNPKRICCISQGTIAQELIKIAIECAKKNPEYLVVYRLHPSENLVWKSLYLELNDAITQYPNFTVECSTDKPLYESFASSQYVFGVSSTALMEAIAAGCKLILCKLSGFEYYESLITQQLVPLVETAEQLSLLLKKQDYNTSEMKTNLNIASYLFANMEHN